MFDNVDDIKEKTKWISLIILDEYKQKIKWNQLLLLDIVTNLFILQTQGKFSIYKYY